MEKSQKSLSSIENSFRHGKIIFEDDHQRNTKPVFKCYIVDLPYNEPPYNKKNLYMMNLKKMTFVNLHLDNKK